MNNKGSESGIIPFGYKLSVFKQRDSSYQYEIIISNSCVMMYNIQAIAAGPALDSNNNVYPCLGLLEDDAKTSFNMTPYRTNGVCNFVSKIFPDGIPKRDQFTLQVAVTWKDSKLVNAGRAFFIYNYTQKDNETNGQRNQKGYIV